MGKRWDWFGRTADGVTIFAAVGSAIVLAVAAPLQQAVMAISLSVLAVAATAVAWLQSRQLHEATQVAVQSQMLANAMGPFSDAMDDFKRGFRAILAYQTPGVTLTDVRTSLVNRFEAGCNDAATAFQSLTGEHCRVTLQELYTVDQPDGQVRAAVRTVATSDRSAPAGPASVDWVDENTDFALLVAGSGFFHSNDLRTNLQEGYRNSHWTEDRLKQWRLDGQYPYLSTVVWPIRVRVDGSHDWDMAGFLSIDSKRTDVFDAAIVKPLGAALASVAYTGLALYGTAKDSQEHTMDARKG